MKIEDVYEYYGSAYKAAQALGVSQQAISKWVKRDCVPIDSQIKLEKITKGALKADKKTDSKTVVDDSLYYPEFRYLDSKYGLCPVRAIVFRKNGAPKIVYSKPGDGREKLSSFNTANLMQALDFRDEDNKRLFIGDILQLKNKTKTKLKILGMGAQLLDMLDKQETFTIIGNLHEGK